MKLINNVHSNYNVAISTMTGYYWQHLNYVYLFKVVNVETFGLSYRYRGT